MQRPSTTTQIMCHRLLLCGLLVMLIGWGIAQPASAQSGPPLPAFPGAEGGGAEARGGRGGRIIEVTNLNDSGPGSLRAAIDANGPRIVVFRVSGVIEVRNTLDISNPYITIAGQTAPGKGILISGVKIDQSPLYIGTHEVIIRYLKVAAGYGGSNADQAGDSVSLGEGGDVYNIVIDHSSLNWGNDENVALWADKGTARNVTFSNNIVGEALNYANHSTGLIVGSNTMCDEMTDVDIIRNLFIHNGNRNPYFKVARGRIVNNLVYNWAWQATQISGGVNVDIIGNRYKRGADSNQRAEVIWRYEGPGMPCNYGPDRDPSIHLRGNIGPNQSNPSGEQWNTMMEQAGGGNGWGWPGNPPKLTRINRAFERSQPLTYGKFPPVVHDVNKLEALLLDDVGASHRLDERGAWTPNRDALDQRLIAEYRQGTGRMRKDEQDAGGFPRIEPATPYADQDRDGMPDTWETMHRFNPANAADGAQDGDNDGYTNIEEFLNGTNPQPKNETPTPTTPKQTATVIPPTATPTPAPNGQTIAKLTLFNAATDQPIGDLRDGATLDLKQLGTTQLSVVATTTPAKVGSVTFALDGQVIQTENFAPYSVKGDALKQGGRNYLPWTPTAGKHTLIVTPYNQAKGQGQAGTPMKVTFTVTN